YIARRAPAEVALVDRLAQPIFKAGEPVIAFRQLARRQHREREQVAVTPISRDLFFAQHLSIPINVIPAKAGTHCRAKHVTFKPGSSDMPNWQATPRLLDGSRPPPG